MNVSQALNIWIIQAVVAVGPPLGALIFTVYMKTDWGISLFFLTPLALVAIPALRVQKVALFRIMAVWLVITLAALGASPLIAAYEMEHNPNAASTYASRSGLARELTEAWRARFKTRWAVVAGTTEIGEPMTFYSADHPAPFTPGEVWSSGYQTGAEMYSNIMSFGVDGKQRIAGLPRARVVRIRAGVIRLLLQ